MRCAGLLAVIVMAWGCTPPAAAQTEPPATHTHASVGSDAYAVLDSSVVKQYVCSMHCERGKTYAQPGECPVCGMMLQLITADRYSVEIQPRSRPLRAGAPVTLDFQIRDPAGFEVRDLQVVHEKLLHLMVVSQDLSWFTHVHPVPDTSGRFSLPYTFPAGGRYILFNDFTPAQVGMQVVPVELDVEGPQKPPSPLRIDDGQPKLVDGYRVALAHTALAIDVDCAMAFTLSRGGKPVTDLEPFLGAMGHLVMISEDGKSYVHSHPIEQTAPRGPRVQFNMTFSRTGLYKAWGQFQRHGRVVTVPFVVEVSVDGHSGNHSPPAGSSGAK